MTGGAYWKLLQGAALLGAIVVSSRAPAPSRSLAPRELRRLVASSLLLYGAGVAAYLTHHGTLAGLVCAGGILVCCLAAWLSRGSEPEWPPGPEDREPPPEPPLEPDWSSLERALRDAGGREPAGVA
jgi:hypothetical protein